MTRPKRSTAVRVGLWYRSSKCCVYCGRKLAIGEATIDHVIPRSKGGTNSHDNLVAACEECNKRKADLSVEEFLKNNTNASCEADDYFNDPPQGEGNTAKS